MDNQNRIIIPESFILIVDDVGWWLPHNKRLYSATWKDGEIDRERPYCLDDYRSLVEIGKALDMRVLCGFTIGEWDRDRVIAGVPNASALGKNWTNSEVLDHTELLDEARDYINSNSDHIEMAVHGLNHMFWTDSGERIPAEYYHDENGKRVMLTPDSARKHLDAWFDIYNRNGFKASVDKFIPCCFRYNYSNGDGELSYILKDYGIKYVSTIFSSMNYDTPKAPSMACIENGILTTDRTKDTVNWAIMDATPPKELKSTTFGAHWPAFVSRDHNDNMKTVARWVEYFRQYKNKFDVVCARDQQMAARQTFYKRFSTLTEIGENRFAIDFSEADKQNAREDVIGKDVFINIKKPFTLIAADDTCTVKLWREAGDFNTYRLTRKGRLAKIELK